MSSLRKITYKSKSVGNLLGKITTKFQFKLLYFYKEKSIVDLIKTTKKETNLAFYPYEAFTVYSIAKAQSVFDGEMAEVGVYRGGSAKLICEAKANRKLHLFDTFEGLPEVTDKDTHFGTKFWQDKQFNDTSEEQVKKYLKSYPAVSVYKGLFPQTGGHVENSTFSFVHLDVDLYKSTLDCLNFFYPRMIRGGIILTHDYHTSGVQQAFKEFFADKKVSIIELTGSQCMIVNS